MSSTENPAVRVLEKEREVVASEIEDMQARLKEARHALRSIEDAIAMLTGAPAPSMRSDGPTLKELILEHLTGDGPGKTPLEIANSLTAAGRETGNTTVSSILSRLKGEGAVEKRNDRWFKTNAKGPGLMPGPFDEELGPATGRGTVFPATPPEGSIPSGSTASRSLGEILRDDLRERNLDDEIPF
jgi:hypothetical protein